MSMTSKIAGGADARAAMPVLARTALLALTALAAFATTPTHAQELGNPGRGQEFALSVCAECHAILPGESQSRIPDATPFAVIAATPGMSERALAAFFQTPHAEMPNLILTGDDRDNVIAYVMSLRPKR